MAELTRYLMIDNASGFVWGEAEGVTPAAACRTLDAGLGVHGRGYAEAMHRPASNETAYLVYEAPGYLTLDGENGQDERLIAEISALPLAAIVTVSAAEE